MALLKCPQCGHTISSLASTCPACGALQTEFRFVQGQQGALTECRRCARKVLSGARTCPYCGVSRPGRRMPYGVLVAAGGLELALWLVGVVHWRAPAVLAPAAPEPAASLPQETARPSVSSGPAASGAGAVRAVPPLPAAAAAGWNGVLRWTVDWANVRQDRSLAAPVLRVLRPGTQVRVGDRLDGWWALYLDGRLAGYLAGSLLSDRAPDSALVDTGATVRRP